MPEQDLPPPPPGPVFVDEPVVVFVDEPVVESFAGAPTVPVGTVPVTEAVVVSDPPRPAPLWQQWWFWLALVVPLLLLVAAVALATRDDSDDVSTIAPESSTTSVVVSSTLPPPIATSNLSPPSVATTPATAPAPSTVPVQTPPPTTVPAATVPPPLPTPAPTPTTAPTPPPSSAPATAFGDGTFAVGRDVAPGIYIAPGSPDQCSWSRQPSSGVAGSWTGRGRAVVELLASDVTVTTAGCNGFVQVPADEVPQPVTELTDGTWRVGEDAAPGTWTAAAGTEPCQWARLRDFLGTPESIVTSGTATTGTTVTLDPADAGFSTQGCSWQPA